MWHRRGLAAATVLVALVGVLLVTWAATVGPSGVIEGDGPTLDHDGATLFIQPSATTSAPVPESVPPEEKSGDGDGSALGNLFVNILTVLFALVLVGLLFAAALIGLPRLRDAVRERRGEPDPETTGFAVVDTPERLARALSEDADRQRSLLAEGSPRNGIVQCWHRFEQLAEEAGLGRRVWETPGEFALRLLTTVDADEDAAYSLTLLYREARFSHHELEESAREDALDALVTIQLGLAARIGSLP